LSLKFSHYNDIRKQKVVEIKNIVLHELNTGIAMVTPSYLLGELLFSEDVKKQRIEIAKNQRIV
jgi:hypothetical protein